MHRFFWVRVIQATIFDKKSDILSGTIQKISLSQPRGHNFFQSFTNNNFLQKKYITLSETIQSTNNQ